MAVSHEQRLREFYNTGKKKYVLGLLKWAQLHHKRLVSFILTSKKALSVLSVWLMTTSFNITAKMALKKPVNGV